MAKSGEIYLYDQVVTENRRLPINALQAKIFLFSYRVSSPCFVLFVWPAAMCFPIAVR